MLTRPYGGRPTVLSRWARRLGLLLGWVSGVVGMAGASGSAVIEDRVYRPNGSAFGGRVVLVWKSRAGETATGCKSARVANGLLRLALSRAETEADTVSVYFVGDDGLHYHQIWRLLPGANPLRVRDVRVGGSGVGFREATPRSTTAIAISDVAGLEDELAIRPTIGPAYGPSRAAVIRASGQLEVATGNLSDCLRVDGTAGPCGSDGVPAGAFIDGETPQGTLDGTNNIFTLRGTPNPPESVQVYRNGLIQKQQLDYSLNASQIEFLPGAVPQPGDTIQVFYRILGQTQGLSALELLPLTFANLPVATNGSLVFCSDCQATNPCAGGGSGAFAKRIGGVWICN